MRGLVVISLILCLNVSCSGDEPYAPNDIVEKPADGKLDSSVRLCELLGASDDCDPCFEAGWYGDGECDSFCAEHDDDCDNYFVLEIDWTIYNSFGSQISCSSIGADTVDVTIRNAQGDVVVAQTALCPLDPVSATLPLGDYVVNGALRKSDDTLISTYGPLGIKEEHVTDYPTYTDDGMLLEERGLSFETGAIFQ